MLQYGIIKKIEHFWKGLSSDRSQISALPPHEYGERFINFISGVTMSQEEATRAAQERDAAMAAEAAAEEERERTGMGNNERLSSTTPPIPNYKPPLPPGQRSPEASGIPVDNVPDRTLRTTAASGKGGHGPNGAMVERRETTVLPVVEETAEGPSTGDRSRNSRVSSLKTESDGRPLTPAKDVDERQPGFGNPVFGGHSGSNGSSSKTRPPRTPPKTGHGYGGQLKPDSADSGYGVGSSSGSGSNGLNGLKSLTGSQKSLNARSQISRNSLDKALPPLPNGGAPRSQDVS